MTDYQGRKIAIDASMAIYQFLVRVDAVLVLADSFGMCTPLAIAHADLYCIGGGALRGRKWRSVDAADE